MRQYSNIIEFFNTHRITMRWKHWWRLTPRQVGHFRACPNSQGVLVATNGILAFTEREGGQDLFLGHLDNFIPDVLDEDENEPALRQRGRKAREIDPILLELVS